MAVSDKIMDQIRDSKTIGRSIISFINGVLCVTLVIISGTSDVNSTEDAIKLRNISVGFGASVTVLNLFLSLVVDIMISACTNNVKDEQVLKELFTSDPADNPDGTIVEGTQHMVSILNQMKIAGNNLNDNTINNQTDFKTQLKTLEDALNKFGTMV